MPRVLGASRLGHGVRSGEDPSVLARVVDTGVTLEVCPASNVALGVYPEAKGVPLPTRPGRRTDGPRADDPLLFGSRLVDQYAVARSGMASATELAELARMSVEVSTAPRTSEAACSRASMPGSPTPSSRMTNPLPTDREDRRAAFSRKRSSPVHHDDLPGYRRFSLDLERTRSEPARCPVRRRRQPAHRRGSPWRNSSRSAVLAPPLLVNARVCLPERATRPPGPRSRARNPRARSARLHWS